MSTFKVAFFVAAATLGLAAPALAQNFNGFGISNDQIAAPQIVHSYPAGGHTKAAHHGAVKLVKRGPVHVTPKS